MTPAQDNNGKLTTAIVIQEKKRIAIIMEPSTAAVPSQVLQTVNNPVGGGDELVMTNHVALNLHRHKPQGLLPLPVEVEQHECSFAFVGMRLLD